MGYSHRKVPYWFPPTPKPWSSIVELSIMQHLLTLASRSTAKKKRQTFAGVIINVKGGNVQWMDIFENLYKKLTDNRGGGRPLWIKDSCESVFKNKVV